MSWFTKESKLESDTRYEIRTLIEKIGTLHKELAKLEGTADTAKLTKQKLQLEVDIEKLKEAHSRETREIEHKVGLHKQQVEASIKIAQETAKAEGLRAVEEARLAVREGNLDAERTRFEQEIEFRTKRFEEEAKTLRNLTSQILERLPTVNVERTFSTVEHIGTEPKAIEASTE